MNNYRPFIFEEFEDIRLHDTILNLFKKEQSQQEVAGIYVFLSDINNDEKGDIRVTSLNSTNEQLALCANYMFGIIGKVCDPQKTKELKRSVQDIITDFNAKKNLNNEKKTSD